MFELTLAAKERLLGSNHPSTLNSRGNLAAAYREAGRATEAIPLVEQTLATRNLLAPGQENAGPAAQD
jgi:Tetratricopeptide repeat